MHVQLLFAEHVVEQRNVSSKLHAQLDALVFSKAVNDAACLLNNLMQVEVLAIREVERTLLDLCEHSQVVHEVAQHVRFVIHSVQTFSHCS